MLAVLAFQIALLLTTSPGRAQEIVARSPESKQDQQSIDSTLSSAQTGPTVDGADADPCIPAETHACSTAVEQANQNPSATLPGVPPDTDFTKGRTWKQLYADILGDQATIVRFPLEVARGHHWQPFLVVAAATAGLIALDPHDSPYFRQTPSFHQFNAGASGLNTGVAMVLAPVVFYAVSAKRNDAYGKHTIFLAAEAVADAQIVTFVMKTIDRRLLPINVPDHRYADTWFEAGLFDSKSFPSGHTITAFTLAEVFSERYKRHRWVPWVTYGLASAIGFSRLTLQAHFPADVFAGAALGVIIPRDVVLHRWNAATPQP